MEQKQDGGGTALPPCAGGAISDTLVPAEPVPDWLARFDSTTAAVIDVRPILAEGREPMAEVLAAAGRVSAEAGLILLAPFNPAPLRALLHERGLVTYGRRLGEGRWNIRVARPAPAPAAAARPQSRGLKLGGATQRLLPEVIPLRFFGVAILAHILVWAGMLGVAEALPGFPGGPSPALAVLHIGAVGVLLATAMGASFQMLPVALAVPPPSARLCGVAFGLLVAGGTGLIAGFALFEPDLMAAGAAALAGAVLIHAWALTRLVAGAADNRLVRWHVAAALTALTAAAGLGVALTLDIRFGWLADHRAAALAHMILAAFGFMGMLVLGFSQVLLPMFAVSEPAGEGLGRVAFALAVAAVAAAPAGLLAGSDTATAAGALAGLGAALGHGLQMRAVLRGRLRRHLGAEFQLYRVSWAVLTILPVLALALLFGPDSEALPTLFVFLAVFGWLLTFLVGVLQRILPFLASMHLSRMGAKAVSPARLTNGRLLDIHRRCHLAAVPLVAVGLLLSQPWAIRIGALAGLAGALCFAGFGLDVLKRTRAYAAASSDRAATALASLKE